jgi:RNA polymerase sigma-70 factor (ECF subfamily)
VVQESLFHAYRKLDTFDDSRPLAPWLFRIAHNHCIDFLRRRGVRVEAETAAAREQDATAAADPPDLPGLPIGRAVEHLVLTLPPKERACVLLKDVFDYSLDEIAELVESTVGGVKAALSRGRAKLAAATPPLSRQADPNANGDLRRLLDLYVERFNARDWEGVRSLISADARLRVVDRVHLRNCTEFLEAPLESLKDSPYFGQYHRMAPNWRMVVADVDGETLIVRLRQDGARWTPFTLIRIGMADDHVREIVDYSHCPWMLEAAGVVTLVS